MDFISPGRANKFIFRPNCKKKSCATREIHLFYSCDWLHIRKINFFSLAAQYTIKSVICLGNNYTSKVNVFPVLDTIFFLQLGRKMNLFAPLGEIKSTLWPASRQNKLFFPSCTIYYYNKIFSFKFDPLLLCFSIWICLHRGK